MVFDVCLGVLGNEANAEDAFQATFLILARKAASIRKAASVGSWLHSVAYRTALQARAQEAARRKSEAHAPVRRMSEPDDLTWRDVRAVLHEELNKLPERYRMVLVMCYLESKTQDQAAAKLGLAKSTLKERLERGRELLRARLVGRGLGPAALLAAAAWPAAVASACLPSTLVSATVNAAGLSVAGQGTAGVISAEVAALSEGVMKTMFLTKLKIATAALLMAGMLGGGWFVSLSLSAKAGEGKRFVVPTATPTDRNAQRLLEEAEKQPKRPKLARMPDPSPELRRELAEFDAYRHGSEEKFVELERKAEELLKKYATPDDQARIYFEVAHIAAQSNITKHVKRVQTYARKSLALSRDPLQRGWLYSYLGSAAEVDENNAFADRRQHAAAELLTGYAEMLAQEFPAKAPELPAVDLLGLEGTDPVEAAQARALHAAKMAARQEADFIRELVHRRDTLTNQLRWLYHPDPRIHGRNPDGPEELRALARKVLNDPKAVEALLARVTEP
jgi:RNA polymerase sigma factor (sigma-70 family)